MFVSNGLSSITALTTDLTIESEFIVNPGQRSVCEWGPLRTQLVKNLPAMQETLV